MSTVGARPRSDAAVLLRLRTTFHTGKPAVDIIIKFYIAFKIILAQIDFRNDTYFFTRNFAVW